MQIFQVFAGVRLYPAGLYVPPEIIVFFSVYKVRRTAYTRAPHVLNERSLWGQIPMVLLRVYAMFYNLLYYVPFVRNKSELRKRVQGADRATIENLMCAAHVYIPMDAHID
jgi:hypothetical protein